MRILSVVGARPNFMKLAPVDRELVKRGVEHVIVHTGQHYDRDMSDAFFEELWIPAPDHHLGVGSGSHARQTAEVMQRLEPVLLQLLPDLVLVYGDVNSTLAAALVAAKLDVRVGHVEAGLRSGDWTMPEEIKRVVTDRLSELLFLPSRAAAANLAGEGIAGERMHFVGNVMIDTLSWAMPQAIRLDAPARHGLSGARFAVVPLHRPANVDDPAVLAELVDGLERLAQTVPVLFPVHPRTRQRIHAQGLKLRNDGGLPLRPRPAGARAAGLSRAAQRGGGCVAGGDRFRRASGGDVVPGRALSHGAAQHRASHHLHSRHEPSRARQARRDPRCRGAGPGTPLAGATGHRAVGRPGGRTHRPRRMRRRAVRARRPAGGDLVPHPPPAGRSRSRNRSAPVERRTRMSRRNSVPNPEVSE